MGEFAPNGLTGEGLSISLLDLSAPGSPAGSFRGDAAFYPASVVKAFYLADFTRGVKTVPGVIPRVFEKVGAHFAAPR